MTDKAIKIYLRKSLKVIVPVKESKGDLGYIATISKNIENLGFALHPSIIARLLTYEKSEVKDFYKSILPTLKLMVGAHKKYEPMYPNFPKQVMKASETELYINAMMHYWGFQLSDMMGDPNFTILPKYKKKDRKVLKGAYDVKWITLGDEENFCSIFTNLVGSNTSISQDDKDIVEWFIKKYDVTEIIPESIPFKENLTYLVGLLEDPSPVVHCVKTATDVLRIAVVFSDGDVSLATSTKFTNMSKAKRRFLMECLENMPEERRTEDMLRWKNRWIRLGEKLHPGQFRNRYPSIQGSFDVIRNGKPFKTFNGKVEEAIIQGKTKSIVSLLEQRPGDFARRLDHILREKRQHKQTIEGFMDVADKVSTPVLLQTYNHFMTREGRDFRAFFPKGNMAKMQYREGRPKSISYTTINKLANGINQVLVDRFSELDELGKVWIDPRLADQMVPFSQRSASKSLRTITRGSSIDLPEGNTVRFFTWWKNIDGSDDYSNRVDLDLSACKFGHDWENKGQLAYYDLRDECGCHSGDITNAPDGACEFIDINLKKVNSDVRYIVMTLHSYSHQPFNSLPECFAGWMIRSKPQSGEVFEPKTVQDKIDLTNEFKVCVPVILDVVDRKMYWADLGLKTLNVVNNASSTSTNMSQIGKAIVNLKKPNLHDLFTMHAEGRGEIVEDQDEADTVFGLYEGNVTAFDTDLIASEYLA